MKRILMTGVVITMLWTCNQASNTGTDGCVRDECTAQDVAAPDTTPDTIPDTIPDTGTDTIRPPAARFTSPEGIAAANGFVYVADPAATYDTDKGKMVYGQAHMVVIDATKQGFPWVVADINVDAKNLQTVTTTGTRVCAVASGTATYDTKTSKMIPESPGKLFCMPLAADSFDIKIDLPLSTKNPLIGLPGSIVILGGFAYIGSGTAPVVYKVDLKNQALVNGADNPIRLLSNAGGATGMARLFTDGTTIYALDFNNDSIYSIDPATDKVTPLGQFGDDPEKMEGPMAGLVATDNKVYAVMNMANSLWQITPDPFAATKVGATGATPNAIVEVPSMNSLFIANSMDNNITMYDLATKAFTTPYARLDPGADPWDLAAMKVNNKTMLFVTAYMEKAVYVFEMDQKTATLLGKVN